MQALKRKLNVHYYTGIALTILVACIGWLIQRHGLTVTHQPIIITAKSMVILYVLCAIPFALWFFHKKMQQLPTNEPTRNHIYTRLALLRIWIMATALCVSVLMCYVLNQTDLLYLAGIAALAYILCKPTTTRLQADLPPIDAQADTPTDMPTQSTCKKTSQTCK